MGKKQLWQELPWYTCVNPAPYACPKPSLLFSQPGPNSPDPHPGFSCAGICLLSNKAPNDKSLFILLVTFPSSILPELLGRQVLKHHPPHLRLENQGSCSWWNLPRTPGLVKAGEETQGQLCDSRTLSSIRVPTQPQMASSSDTGLSSSLPFQDSAA